MFSPTDFHSGYFFTEDNSVEKFSNKDFHAAEYNVVLVVSPVEPQPEPLPKEPLNAYKQFKAIRGGHTYYMAPNRDRFNGY